MDDDAIKAAAELWRLAVAQEIIWSVERGTDMPPEPSREALDEARWKRPDLWARAK